MQKSIPIIPIIKSEFSSWLKKQSELCKNIVANNKFVAEQNSVCLIIKDNGKLDKVLLGIKDNDDYTAFGVLPKSLPDGNYEILAAQFSDRQIAYALIGWRLGSYQFSKYKKIFTIKTSLIYKKSFLTARAEKIAEAIFWVRDLINTPAGDMRPDQLADQAVVFADKFGAKIKLVRGEKLAKEFPAVHAVGRGSENSPVLIDMSWGRVADPRVVLIGKGVCFDSGGLSLKPSGGMLFMKKDMGGAAIALGLASLIMAEKLPINLRLIIAAVENMPSGNSYKLGDIIKTRKKTTVEITNTDAEGRLVLADCLALAAEDKPDFVFDFATLTGAARVALGNDISALFTKDDKLAEELLSAAEAEGDPIWRLPLYQPYTKMLSSEIADLKNCYLGGDGGGAITAALFLQHFVPDDIIWAHIDTSAYNVKSRPAKPEGGEAMCLMALFRYFLQHFEK